MYVKSVQNYLCINKDNSYRIYIVTLILCVNILSIVNGTIIPDPF